MEVIGSMRRTSGTFRYFQVLSGTSGTYLRRISFEIPPLRRLCFKSQMSLFRHGHGLILCILAARGGSEAFFKRPITSSQLTFLLPSASSAVTLYICTRDRYDNRPVANSPCIR